MSDWAPDHELIYKRDAGKALQRLEAWWQGELIDRPVIQICAPLSNPKPLPEKKHPTLQDRWMDVDYTIERTDIMLGNTYWGGEYLPVFFPNLGPEIMAAAYGCEIEFGEDTSWSIPSLKDWDTINQLSFNPKNPYIQCICEMTRRGLEVGRDKFIVGHTDLHPGGDLAASLRDPQQLCMDLVLEPEKVHLLLNRIHSAFWDFYNLQYDLMKAAGQTITSSWLPLFTNGKYYIPSNDFSCMISKDMFREFFLDEIIEEIEWLDRSIYHLDGPGALQHLDTLLDIDKLDAIQWVWGAGKGSATDWIDTFVKIQDAGKKTWIPISVTEMDTLMDALEPAKTIFSTWVGSPEDAEAIIERISRWTAKGKY